MLSLWFQLFYFLSLPGSLVAGVYVSVLLMQIPLELGGSSGRMQEVEGAFLDDGMRGPGSKTQFSALHTQSLPCFLPYHWTTLCGICWLLRQDCLGLQRAKKLPVKSPLLFILQGAPGCVLRHLCSSLLFHLPNSFVWPTFGRSNVQISDRCFSVGWVLFIGCWCSACFNFKGRDQGRSLMLPCFWCYYSFTINECCLLSDTVLGPENLEVNIKKARWIYYPK